MVSASLAGIIGGRATAWLTPATGWIVGTVAFVGTLLALFTYWNRSTAEIQRAIRPLNPTPQGGPEPTI